MRYHDLFRVLLTCSALCTRSQVVYAATNTASAPVSLDFGTDFFGTDGQWSAAQIRAGTPEQYLSAYPSTVRSETWVIGPGGCDASVECATARGGLFYANQSTTYHDLGPYGLGYNPFGIEPGYTNYALDNISISDTISAPSQVIGSFTGLDPWLGELGLGVQETRFEGRTDYSSLISSLVQNESVIPSHSYGYTAGAQYAVKNVPGSLILGGVDTTRYIPNDVSFALSPGYLPKVAVQGIAVGSSQSQALVAMPPNWNANPLALVQSPISDLFTIDTSTPFLWMPAAVCDAFAAALNLTYDYDLELYIFPANTSAQALNDWGLEFTFTLADSVDSTTRIQLPISYDAFNLQLSYGFPNLNISYGDPAVDYFPLRRANSSTQYTIGRAFLQESYLIVDYERNNFSLSTAIFTDSSTVAPQVVPITRPANSQWPGAQAADTNSLSAGAKVGIGVGIALAVITILAFVLYAVHRRRKHLTNEEKGASKTKWSLRRAVKKHPRSDAAVSELSGDRRHPRELLVDSSNTRFELAGRVPVEMPAGEVPENFLSTNRAINELATSEHDVSGTRELAHGRRTSIRKDYNIRATATERSTSPAPPYTSSEIGPNSNSGSEGISPFDMRGSVAFGSHSSGEPGISPVSRQIAKSNSDGGQSPISPTRPMLQNLPTPRVTSDMTGHERSSALSSQQDRVTRRASHDSPIREEGFLEDESRTSDSAEAPPQVRARFSWEE